MASSTNMVVRHSAPDNGREPHYGSNVLEALPLPVAVLDGQGVIRVVNAAWKRLEPPDFAPGAAYCVACESSFDLGMGGLAVVESGIRNVIGGYRESFSAEFGARSGPGMYSRYGEPACQRWLHGRGSHALPGRGDERSAGKIRRSPPVGKNGGGGQAGGGCGPRFRQSADADFRLQRDHTEPRGLQRASARPNWRRSARRPTGARG